MPASNIETVNLVSSGQVTIEGTITDMEKHNLRLLHVWLAQPGCSSGNGAGLALDCLNDVVPADDGKTATFERTTKSDDAASANPGVVGSFVDGPAIVSAIAVLVPKEDADPNNGVVAEVIQWGRTVMLSQNTVDTTASAESQAATAA